MCQREEQKGTEVTDELCLEHCVTNEFDVCPTYWYMLESCGQFDANHSLFCPALTKET